MRAKENLTVIKKNEEKSIKKIFTIEILNIVNFDGEFCHLDVDASIIQTVASMTKKIIELKNIIGSIFSIIWIQVKNRILFI